MYPWLIVHPDFIRFLHWVQAYFWQYFIFLVFIKIGAIVWPPFPGGVFTFASIPIIGWFNAFLADAIGSLIGATLAYYLGRKYGKSLIKKLFDESMVSKIDSIRVVREKEVEAVLVCRFLYSAIGEVIMYGSGLLHVRFRNFFAASVVFTAAQAPVYFIVSSAYERFSFGVFVITIVAGIVLFGTVSRRYIEKI